MPSVVRLVTEHGEILKELGNPHGIIERLHPSLDDQRSICWRFIDPYGDTYFNYLQMQPFIEELDHLAPAARDEQAQAFLKQLRALAEECRDGDGLFLMFYGD
jgi:hypothetical protein